MIDLWYPKAIRDEAPEGYWGSRTAGGAKFLLHTTESALGAYALGSGPRSYYGNPYWPNYTLAIVTDRWRVVQHIPANYGACALMNQPGGVETNRACSQIEITTRSVDVAQLPDAALDELAALLVWEHQVRGVPLVSTVRWVPYPASYGAFASQRLSGPAWTAYAGIAGHQHCPENDHGDPGAFPIDALLARARALLNPEDVVTEQDKNDIAAKVLALLQKQVFAVSPAIHQGNAGEVIGATYNKTGTVQAQLAWLTAAVEAIASNDGVVLPAQPA